MRARQKATPENNLPRVDPVQAGPLHIYPASVPAEEITLLDLWRVFARYRSIVLGIAALAGLLSLAAALLMTSKYRAEVLLAPVSDPNENESYAAQFSGVGGIAALAGINLDHKDRKSESIATLRSRKFTDQFIQDGKLDRVLFAEQWDRGRERWKSEGDIPTAWDTYQLFDKHIRLIHEDRSTGLVTLSIEWKDPELAAQWANKLVSDVNSTLRQQAVDDSDQAIEYLQEQLSRTSVVELQQVLHRLIEAEMKQIILANVNEEYAFKVIDPAAVPQEPVSPKVAMMVVLGTVLGLVLGVVVALVLNGRRDARSLPLSQPNGSGSAD